MQIQKEEIRLKIIDIARDEFIINGFQDASLRVIAARAGITLSNIYNYFKNKDDLFTEIIKPTLEVIEQQMLDHNSEQNMTIDYFRSEQMQQTELLKMVALIESHRTYLQLLLFKSTGSSHANFREDMIRSSTLTGQEYLLVMKEKYPEISIDISPFFIHFMGSMWVNIMSEVVSHSLSHEQITKFISEYIAFGTAGWERIMKIK
ncbi:MAG: TetR/AcrR family transcriptional regulator [Paludibacteraceae bacterium]